VVGCQTRTDPFQRSKSQTDTDIPLTTAGEAIDFKIYL